MSWTTPGQGYFKSNLNEASIDQIMKAYPRENINTISALRDIAGGRGKDGGRTADKIAGKFVSYMINVSQTDKKLYAKYKKMNFKDLFSKNLDKFKNVKGLNLYRIKSGSLKEDAAAAADLKAKQAVEVERLKDKQESENDALKLKHERENEQQKKKDESEKEAEKNQASRESVGPVDEASPLIKNQPSLKQIQKMKADVKKKVKVKHDLVRIQMKTILYVDKKDVKKAEQQLAKSEYKKDIEVRAEQNQTSRESVEV